MEYILLVVGLGLLVLGGEGLVRGGVALAKIFRVSPLLVGLTIVAYGTSMPEMLVSVDAALRGSSGIALGNAVGSNIFNILVILGLTAVVLPIAVEPRAIYRDGAVALGAALVLGLLVWSSSELLWWHGLLFLAALVAALVNAYRSERDQSTPAAELHLREAEQIEAVPQRPWLAGAFVIGGLLLLAVGARLLVDASIEIARDWGVSETVIGLTLVAAGTSLPELATSLVAAFRRQADIALGNIIGSNIFNVLAILGVASLVAPLEVPTGMGARDVPVMIAATVLLLPPLFLGRRISRAYGLFFLIGYVAYTLVLTNARVGI